PTGTPERVVMVTFDDARREALRLGTAVAQDFNTTFLMHVPVGHVDHDSYTSSWEQMKAAQATGRWRFGSHLMEAHEVLHMESDNSVIHPLANRLWLAAPNRLETENEYDARIKYEYQRSREIMQQKLGGAADIIAYPMGDLGQETRSDMPEALTVNLREAAANYKTGFIQSQFGYAVNGDNPLLYQRHELGRLPGAEAVEYLLRNHPVFLAHRLRAEYAAQEGKIYKSKDALAQLRQDGYPTNAYNKVASYVYERLTGVRTTPVGISKVTKGPFHLELKDPYVGVRAEYLKDNLDSRNWRLLGLGGLNLTPNITVEGTAGIGRMQQAFTNNLALNGPEIRLDERTVGVAPAVKFPNGWVLLGELSDRHFTGKVPTDLNGHTANFDKTVIQYAAEAQIKPLLPLDVAARWEHDIVPSARAALKDTTYNAGTLAAAYRLFDWWDLNASGTRYMFSDSNNRNHLMAESLWLLYEPAGFRLGLRYEYTSADEASPDYWTPYKLNRYYLEAFFRRTYRRIYYNIGVRYGLGKESLRPEAKRKYQEDLQQLQQSLRTARSRRFSPATIRNFQHYIDVLLANPIEEPGWEPVLGLVAATRIKLGGHWELNGEVSYNRLPDYNSLNLLGGIKFKF
ncbi:MAG: polysaccharide deacetylase family protein, partial [Kiritimatiellaeota bacterium]|nr:polysaccharide deacetylase family protein [Kiritimatiellota bacterium]